MYLRQSPLQQQYVYLQLCSEEPCEWSSISKRVSLTRLTPRLSMVEHLELPRRCDSFAARVELERVLVFRRCLLPGACWAAGTRAHRRRPAIWLTAVIRKIACGRAQLLTISPSCSPCRRGVWPPRVWIFLLSSRWATRHVRAVRGTARAQPDRASRAESWRCAIRPTTGCSASSRRDVLWRHLPDPHRGLG